VDLPGIIDGDLGVDGQPPGDLPVGGVQRLGVPGQQPVRVGGQAEGSLVSFARTDRSCS